MTGLGCEGGAEIDVFDSGGSVLEMACLWTAMLNVVLDSPMDLMQCVV